jgi:hypothetical protein
VKNQRHRGQRRVIGGLTLTVMITLAACSSAASSPPKSTTPPTTTPTTTASTVASTTTTGSSATPAIASTVAALTTPGPQSGCPSAACSTITSQVAASTHLQQIPANLTPPLQNAGTDLVAPANCVKSSLDITVAPVNEPCTVGTNASAPDIVLFGDSHALMWATSLATIAQRVGDRFTLLDYEACRLPIGVPFPNLPANCAAWRQAAVDWIKQTHPALVVLSSIYNPGGGNPASAYQQFSTGWETLLSDITIPGTRLAMIGSIPVLTQDGPTCLAAHESSIRSCSTPASRAVLTKTLAAEQTAVAKESTSFVNPTPWLCTGTVCPAVVGQFTAYQNQFHITSTYGNYLSHVLAGALSLGS